MVRVGPLCCVCDHAGVIIKFGFRSKVYGRCVFFIAQCCVTCLVSDWLRAYPITSTHEALRSAPRGDEKEQRIQNSSGDDRLVTLVTLFYGMRIRWANNNNNNNDN